MAKTPSADESTAGEPTPHASANLAPAESNPVTVAPAKSRTSRWVLSSIAAVGILGLGLLGGVLIGQNVGNPSGHDRGSDARIVIEHQQSGQGDRVPERLQERFRERLQDIRESKQPGQNQQTPKQQVPATPAPGDNG